jgi:hypothetical protein
LLITLSQSADFPKVVFHTASEMLLLRLLKSEFVFQSQANTLDFGLEPKPNLLLIFFVFFEEQAEGFFSTELGNTCEVFDPEAVENLGSLQLALS